MPSGKASSICPHLVTQSKAVETRHPGAGGGCQAATADPCRIQSGVKLHLCSWEETSRFLNSHVGVEPIGDENEYPSPPYVRSEVVDRAITFRSAGDLLASVRDHR